MAVIKRVYHEYMPSKDSMAAKIVDVKSAVKQKYIDTIQMPSKYPYRVLQIKSNDNDLKTLLAQYTTDDLKGVIDALELDIKKNNKKVMLQSEIYNNIIKSFSTVLKTVNHGMYQFIINFKDNKKYFLKDYRKQHSYLNYLLRRGYLFRYMYENEEMLLMPKELIDISDKLDQEEMINTVNKNTTVCNIGEGILYYYGVIDCDHFFMYLDKLLNNLENGRKNTKVDFSKMKYSYYKNEGIYSKTEEIFKNYVEYGAKVNEYYFNDYYNKYYSHYSVFDPYNIFFEQNRRKDIDFLPLSCNDLTGEYSRDSKAKKAMYDYLINNLKINMIQANMMVEEWSSYVKNGEHPGIYIDIMIEYINFESITKINEMLSYSNDKFVNRLSQWPIKGHSPNDLLEIMKNGIQKVHTLQKETNIEDKNKWGKTGRNDPCPCGSGKKYKKCCGK